MLPPSSILLNCGSTISWGFLSQIKENRHESSLRTAESKSIRGDNDFASIQRGVAADAHTIRAWAHVGSSKRHSFWRKLPSLLASRYGRADNERSSCYARRCSI